MKEEETTTLDQLRMVALNSSGKGGDSGLSVYGVLPVDLFTVFKEVPSNLSINTEIRRGRRPLRELNSGRRNDNPA